MAEMCWINMLLKNSKDDMGGFTPNIFLTSIKRLFQMVINAIIGMFSSDHILLEMQGLLILQKICILLNSKIAYIRMVESLSNHDLTITSGIYTKWSSSQPWYTRST